MSNMPPLRTVHGNGAFMSRPKHTWRGYRLPRSSRRQWEDTMAYRRYMQARKVVELPEQPDDWETCDEPVCQAARSMNFTATAWQHHLMHQMNKEEQVA